VDGATYAVDPQGEGQSEPATETAEPLGVFKTVKCPSGEDGIACMQRCADAGISCASGLRHPYKPDAGDGTLFLCTDTIVHACSYWYENGDRCVFFGGGRRFPWCAYVGGRP
jgi:hypothetical protein